MSNTLQIRSQVWYYSIKLDTSWVARRAWVDIWSISNISGSTTATTKTKTSLDAQRIVLSNDTMKSPESNSKIVYRNHFHFFLDTVYMAKSSWLPIFFYSYVKQLGKLYWFWNFGPNREGTVTKSPIFRAICAGMAHIYLHI